MLEIINNKLFFNKYRIKKLIFKTKYSLLYEGINIKQNEPVAMKFEKRISKENLLQSEAFLLFILKGFGIPKVITYGKSGLYNILIQELLGLSISDLWKLKKKENENILRKDICMIALQCIDRLEYIHSKNIIHRDIKPHNFLIGRKDPKIIYLIDFGFSRKYRSSRTGKHIKFKNNKMICGSLKFISVNGNRGYELSRRDDLESLAYMLIYLGNKSLPWTKVDYSKPSKNIIEIFRIKNLTTPEKLCKGLPEEYAEFLKYAKKLEFEQEPNYIYLKSLFTSILTKNQLKNDYLFFWIISKKETHKEVENIEKKSNSLKKRKGSSQKRLYNKIKKSLEKIKNQEKEDLNNINIKKIKMLSWKSLNGDKINNTCEKNNDSSYYFKIPENNKDNIPKQKINLIPNKNTFINKDKNKNKNNIIRISKTIFNKRIDNKKNYLIKCNHPHTLSNNLYIENEVNTLYNSSRTANENKTDKNSKFNKKYSFSNNQTNFNEIQLKDNIIYKTILEREKKNKNSMIFKKKNFNPPFFNNNKIPINNKSKDMKIRKPLILIEDNSKEIIRNKTHRLLNSNEIQTLYDTTNNNYNIIHNSFLVTNKDINVISSDSARNINKKKKLFIKIPTAIRKKKPEFESSKNINQKTNTNIYNPNYYIKYNKFSLTNYKNNILNNYRFNSINNIPYSYRKNYSNI